MARIFVADGREFPDPDPAVSVEDVRKQLAEFLPELTNADVREEKRGDDRVYVFTRRIGTKGHAGRRRGRESLAIGDVVEAIRRVPEKRLRVFEIAVELFDARGDLDVDAAAERGPEVNLAVAEAEAYARGTDRALAALGRLPAR
jgi:PRTRC genetic system protein C